MLSKYWHWIKKYKVWLGSILALGIAYTGLPEVLRCCSPEYMINGWFDYSYKLTKAEDTEGVARGLAFLLAVPIAFFALILTALRTTAQTAQSKTDSDRLLAETFAKSIELLGHKKPAVRQGAIYALGKIAETNRSELVVIMHTLCAFVRHGSGVLNKPLKIDIEAAIKTIVKISSLLVDNEVIYDLSNIELEGADFSNANLTRFNLSDSNFNQCMFEKVKFHNSNWVGSVFSKCFLEKVEFDDKTQLSRKGQDQKTNLSTVKGLTQEILNKVTSEGLKINHQNSIDDLKLPKKLKLPKQKSKIELP